METFICSIIIGALAGWIAEKILKEKGYGIAMNLIIGISGSIVGGWIFHLTGLEINIIIGSIVMDIIGAAVLLWSTTRLKEVAYFK